MPAIDLARLRKQAVRLADLFDQPQFFMVTLRETLEFYVNRTMRANRAVTGISVLPSFQTPGLVLRTIETEIGPLAEANPAQALELADALWDAGWLETRLMAAILLGRLPPQEERLLARLSAWSGQVRDPNVRQELLTTSLTRLRVEMPERFLELVREWLQPQRQRFWTNGVRALIPLITAPDFENLPPVLDLVEPVLEAAPAVLQNDFIELVNALYRVSPTETTYFLKQLLGRSENPQTAILFRRISPSLPAELQAGLRGLIRRRE